jgi:glycosyltransferase involved in cell wall biosynthesis
VVTDTALSTHGAACVTAVGYHRPVTLSVVIPALNEEDGIADLIHRVQEQEPDLRAVGVEQLEIIVVDDGSRDHTADIAAQFPEVRLVRHATNRGYGAAIKTGFGCAHGELLGFLDADGTYPPEGFTSLCRVALDAGADLVVGSRRSGAASQMPVVRRIGNFIWANLVTLVGDHRVVDPASGMRVLRQAALQRLYPLPDGLNFTPVMSTRAVYEGLRLVEIPVPYRERIGHSKLSIVHDGTRFLTTILWTTLEYNPVRLLGLVGVAALAMAVAIGLALVALRLQGVNSLGPWGIFSVFSALVLTVAGVSIFSLGATFSYLVRLFHHQPVRQGLFGRPLFSPSLERHFGWLGMLATSGGVTLGGGTVALDLWGWDIARVWFWLVVSALLVLVGIQLVLSWMLMRVLERLSLRELHIGREIALEVTDKAL